MKPDHAERNKRTFNRFLFQIERQIYFISRAVQKSRATLISLYGSKMGNVQIYMEIQCIRQKTVCTSLTSLKVHI